MNLLLHLLFIITFGLLFFVAAIIIRPFRLHRRRAVSTIAIKISYLLYLLTFLVLSYLFLFYFKSTSEIERSFRRDPYMIYYIAMIIAFFVPNFGIMFRRKFKEFRTPYNVIFTVINLFTTLVLFFIIYAIDWEY